MSSNTRSRYWVAFGLCVALGCASTSPAPDSEPADSSGAPLAGADASAGAASSSLPPRLVPVYFDTDSAVLRADARAALETQAKSIVEHPEWGVLAIDGHCDERGSEQYNTGLGQDRAAAVARFLVASGVDRSRLATRSFGEAKPVAYGHNEAAWSQNRRSELQFESLTSANP